jgi:hypothetical protein
MREDLVSNGLEARDWELLLRRIKDGKCTAFIGPEVSAEVMPLREQIAQSWAHQYDYPLADTHDLARVAQYMAVQYDPIYPKEEMQKQITAVATPDFTIADQPHSVLAQLGLPVYITTNYDGLIERALRHHKKDPKQELCRWNAQLQRSQPSILETGYDPTPANPLVYHLHGHYQTPESLVLTEDDYLDFLVNISSETFQLPHRIQRAVTGASLLFIGYNPTDWDFRVLFRGLVAATEAGLRRISVTVQLPPVPEGTPAATQAKVQRYLDDYFSRADTQLRTYWGTTQQFITELWQHWQGIEAEKTAVPSVNNEPRIDPMKLLKNLTDSFDKEEMTMLAFELRVDYENLPERKDGFARELIVYLQHRKRLYELVTICQRERPSKEW